MPEPTDQREKFYKVTDAGRVEADTSALVRQHLAGHPTDQREITRALELCKWREKGMVWTPAEQTTVARAYIDHMEPVEIRARDAEPVEFRAIPHECPSCKTSPVYRHARFCFFCGKPINWKSE